MNASRSDRKYIIERDHSICLYCDKDLCSIPNEISIDHIKPIAQGGKSLRSNLCVSCNECNSDWAARTKPKDVLIKVHKRIFKNTQRWNKEHGH